MNLEVVNSVSKEPQYSYFSRMMVSTFSVIGEPKRVTFSEEVTWNPGNFDKKDSKVEES